MERKKANKPSTLKTGIVLAICSAAFYLIYQGSLALTAGYALPMLFFIDNPALEARIQLAVLLNLGIISGAMLAAAKNGRLRKWSSTGWRFKRSQLAFALIGGILIGYGARIANGCFFGAALAGIPAGSLQGWFFAIFLIPGVLTGVFIINYFTATTKKASKTDVDQVG